MERYLHFISIHLHFLQTLFCAALTLERFFLPAIFMEEKKPISPDQVGRNIRLIDQRDGWPTCSSLYFEYHTGNYRTRPTTASDDIGIYNNPFQSWAA